MIELIIADDHTLFIDGLRSLLKDEKDMHVMDIANDGKELLSILSAVSPDIILLDINMPLLNGLDTTKYIRQIYPRLKIIMLSTYNDEHLIERSKELGANGYLLKTTGKEELLQTIRLVSQGQSCFPYRFPKTADTCDETDRFLKQFNITNREKEVLQHIKAGLTNQQIAEELFLSVYTVETHRKNIMHKLQLNTPALLMKFIIENHL